MNTRSENNRRWADKIIKGIDPTHQYRWQAYDQKLTMLLSPTTVWLDIGCGNNGVIQDHGHEAGVAIGVDRKMLHTMTPAMFVCADVYNLPFRPGSVDLITLRFIVEHIQNVSQALAEVAHVLKSKGNTLLLTTNIWCPFVFLPRVLPFSIKKYLIMVLYRVFMHDVQPTYHRFNSPHIIMNGTQYLKKVYIEYIQDTNFINRVFFLITFCWHVITKMLSTRYLRSCILVIYKKV